MMHTVMTTNAAYDSILLVDDNDIVVGCWTANTSNVLSYLDRGDRPESWGTTLTDLWLISDYGEECGRDGVITSAERRAFWHEPFKRAFLRFRKIEDLLKKAQPAQAIYWELLADLENLLEVDLKWDITEDLSQITAKSLEIRSAVEKDPYDDKGVLHLLSAEQNTRSHQLTAPAREALKKYLDESGDDSPINAHGLKARMLAFLSLQDSQDVQANAEADASSQDQNQDGRVYGTLGPSGPLPQESNTLFERTQDAQRLYWELLSDLEDSLDVEIDGTADLQSMTVDELKDRRGKSQCNGSGCEVMVGPRDPYFATPCGSYCSECMETEHAPGCGICASEFDLKGSTGEQPSPASQPDAQAELKRLLPGVIERKSIATGTNAVFSPDGKCLAFGWEDALRVWKEMQP